MKTSGQIKEVLFEDIPARTRSKLNRARRRFWMASYVMPDSDLQEAMERAVIRGVDVRLVVSSVAVLELPEGRKAKMKRVASDSGTMHSKFVIVDDEVIVGSSNFNEAGSRNAAVILTGPAVRHFVIEFNKIWKLKPGPNLLRGEEANAFVEAAAKRTRWTPFLTQVAKRVRARGYLTPREKAAVENIK